MAGRRHGHRYRAGPPSAGAGLSRLDADHSGGDHAEEPPAARRDVRVNSIDGAVTRATGRCREFARAALGANRRPVVRQLLAEALVLGVAGGVLGLVLGTSIVPALLRSSPVEIPYWIRLEPDWRVLAFALLVGDEMSTADLGFAAR